MVFNSPAPLSSLTCAALAMLGFILPGIAQTLFLKSAASEHFNAPIDGGRTFRGRRVFGENKTWKGFVVMIPLTTITYALIGALATRGVFGPGVWALDVAGWAKLGLAASCGYTLGELPNSFIKRQCGVAPGEAPEHPIGRRVAFVADQMDSIVCGLCAIALMVPTDGVFWAACLGIGATIHWLFNVLLYALGIKERAA